jgi:hypothetical protein
MKLILENGYPYPYPKGLSDEEGERVANDAPDIQMELKGVRAFEWLHTMTIEFESSDAALAAIRQTDWDVWDAARNILEAKTSSEDGYGHPAIIVGDKAYCGFIVAAE